ncbi:microfibril-associated glycoprotein 4-like [Symphorus nematophorus]
MKLTSVVVLLLAPVLTSCTTLPVDCSDIQKQGKNLPSGVYTIFPVGATSAVQVYCDLKTDGGRWTVFQRRMDGTVAFYRGWDQYKAGFGNAHGEYWLGLDNIHHLTSSECMGKYELRVDMEDFGGKKVFAKYSAFAVGPESSGYQMTVSGFKNGGAGNALSWHNNNKFTTFDKDQDLWKGGNCAKRYLGAFWYRLCHTTNPNGVYRWGYDKTVHAVGLDWKMWKGYDYSLKTISFKIRPVQ